VVNDCGDLVELLNVRPKRLLVDLWNFCNFQCPHCCQEAGPLESRRGLDAGVYLSTVRKAAEAGIPGLTFLGGEPLLHPRLPEMIGTARRFGLEVGIVSNGWSLTEGLATELYAAGCSEIALSFYGHTPDLHESMTSKHGSFERLQRAASIAQDAGLKVRVNFLVSAANARTIPTTAFWKTMAALGPAHVKIANFLPMGRGEDVAANLAADPCVYLEILEALKSWTFPFRVTMAQCFLRTGVEAIGDGSEPRCRDMLGELPAVLRNGTFQPCCLFASAHDPPHRWSLERLHRHRGLTVCDHLPRTIQRHRLVCPLVEIELRQGPTLEAPAVTGL